MGGGATTIPGIVIGAIADLFMVIFKLRWRAMVVWVLITLALRQFPYLKNSEAGRVISYFLIMIGLVSTGPNARKLGFIGIIIPIGIYILGLLMALLLPMLPNAHSTSPSPANHATTNPMVAHPVHASTKPHPTVR